MWGLLTLTPIMTN